MMNEWDLYTWWPQYVDTLPHDWSFVHGIRQSPADSQHKGPLTQSYDGMILRMSTPDRISLDMIHTDDLGATFCKIFTYVHINK